MAADKKGYVRLFFKVLLLAVYFAFFSVQLFLRYTSSNSLQSLALDLDNYHKNIASKSFHAKALISQKDTKKNKNLTYLNKRFHPQDEVTIPSHDFQIRFYYSEVAKNFFFRDVHTVDIKINSASLRGPPVLG